MVVKRNAQNDKSLSTKAFDRLSFVLKLRKHSEDHFIRMRCPFPAPEHTILLLIYQHRHIAARQIKNIELRRDSSHPDRLESRMDALAEA